MSNLMGSFSLEQLSLAEFSGEYDAVSKVYEDDHKNILGIWLDLVLIVKYSIFQKKNSVKNMKIGEQLLLMTYFDNFDF